MSTAFRNVILVAGLWLLPALPALAQTAPGWTYGYVPTPAQWNAAFAGKQDYLGAAPLLVTGGSMTGPLVTAASAAGSSGFNLPPGTAPTSPVNGDLWTTSAGVFAQINGATVALTGASAGSFAATSPITISFPAGVVTYACATCAVTGSPLSQFAATTSAQLRGVISDETGTGLAAFATNPTLTGVTVTTAFTATGLVGLPNLASQAANTIVAATSSGSPTALPILGCVGSANALQWVTGTGFQCQAITAAAGSIAVGTTTITSGTINNILVHGASNILQEYTLSGTGTVVAMAAGPTFTGTVAAAAASFSGTVNFTGAFQIAGVAQTFPASGLLVGTTDTQTLSGKTLTAPIMTTPQLGVATGTSLALGGCTIGANVFCGTGSAAISSTLTSAAHAVTSASANALVAGPSGAANPGFNVDASTASSATGLNIKSAAAGAGVALSAISSGTNENFTIDAKGSGTITLGGTSTGAIVHTRATTLSAALTYGGIAFANTVTGSAGSSLVGSISPTFSGSVTTANINAIGTLIVQSAAAEAVAFGASGATNPAFWVDASSASSATGLKIKSAAAAGGVALSVITSGTNENFTIDAAGSGTVTINGTGTGAISLARNTSITGTGTITSASASAFAVGLNGGTNSAFQVDASTALSVTGIKIKSGASGGGVAITATSSSASENIFIDGLGTGGIAFGNTSTGPMSFARPVTFSGALTYGGVALTNAVTGTGKMVLDTNSTQSNLTVTTAFTATGLVTYADMASAAIATQANYFAGAASVLVPASGIYTPEITTTFAAAQTIDFSTFINTVITLTANMTSMTLSNVAAGKAGQIRFVQDGTGSRLFSGTWPSAFKWAGGSTPTFGTNANESDNLQYNCTSATYCTAFLVKDAR